MKRDMTLYKYCDIYMLMRRMTERQITRLMCRAEALHMLDILCFAILQTAELFASANCIAVQRAAKAMLGREAFLQLITELNRGGMTILSARSLLMPWDDICYTQPSNSV